MVGSVETERDRVTRLGVGVSVPEEETVLDSEVTLAMPVPRPAKVGAAPSSGYGIQQSRLLGGAIAWLVPHPPGTQAPVSESPTPQPPTQVVS